MKVTPTEQAGESAIRYAAAAVLASGTLLRFFGLGRRQLWLDEIIQLKRFADGPLLERVLNLNREIAAAPLDYLLQDAVVAVVGRGEWAARLHAALFGCLALWVFYRLCRRIFPPRAALTALLLLAVSPLHIWYSQEGRSYSLLLLLATAAYAALYSALRRGGGSRWTVYGVLLILCLYTNYLGLVVVAAQAVFVMGLALGRERLRDFEPGAAGGLGAFAGAAGIALLAFTPWLIHTSSAARATVPSVFLEGGLWLRLFKEISGGGYFLSLLLCILFAGGAWTLWRNGERVRLWLLLSWLAAPLVAVPLLAWWRGYFLAIRQLLICLPPLLAGAGLGWAALRQSRRAPRFTAPAVLVLAVAISLGAVWKHSGEEEADWRSLVQFLSQLDPNHPIVAPNIEFALSYYLPDLPSRSVALRADEISDFLCRRPGAAVVLAESRYMDADQSAVADRLKETNEVLQAETLHGFEVRILGCSRRDDR